MLLLPEEKHRKSDTPDIQVNLSSASRWHVEEPKGPQANSPPAGSIFYWDTQQSLLYAGTLTGHLPKEKNHSEHQQGEQGSGWILNGQHRHAEQGLTGTLTGDTSWHDGQCWKEAQRTFESIILGHHNEGCLVASNCHNNKGMIVIIHFVQTWGSLHQRHLSHVKNGYNCTQRFSLNW